MRKTLVSAALFAALFLAVPAQAADVYKPRASVVFPFGGVAQAMTNDLGSFTQVVRLLCTSACFVAIGSTAADAVVTATGTTSYYLPANAAEYFRVNPGANIAVIQASSSGTLYITEMTQ